jgi:hypothetical protein
MACPSCKTPLGYSFSYRVILLSIAYSVWGLVIFRGYTTYGPGWLLLGPLIALVPTCIAGGIFKKLFPPNLEPYAVGNVWLKLQ